MDSVEQFFRDNPRAWIVGVVAVLVLAFSVWGIWGGFSFQAGRSLAGDCIQGPLPAVSGQGSFFHSTCDGALAAQFGVSPSEPIAGCIGVLDFTAKSDDNRPGFTTKDPVWTCNGPFTLSRTTCFNPRGQLTGKGNVSCSADMGAPLGVKTVTFTVTKGLGDSVVTGVQPTPVPIPVSCAPVAQSVALGQPATVTAVGGNRLYQWSITGSGVQVGGTSSSVMASYTVPGQKVVRVTSAGQIATCSVAVLSSGTGTTLTSGTPTGSTVINSGTNTVTGTSASSIGGAQSGLTVIKRGVNAVTGTGGTFSAISLNQNEIAQFTVSITNNRTTVVDGLRVLDMLPTGTTYRIGSTTIDGQALAVDSITTSGLALGSLEPGANVIIRWSATADATGQLAGGPQQSQPRVLVTANDISDTAADMSVTVFGSGFSGSDGSTNGEGTGNFDGTVDAGDVATGPGSAVTIALVMAAALTLLYSGYTRSAAYRRTEIDTISQRQGPMDFRS